MKEAIGTSMIFNLVMIFVGVFIALYVGSIAYSKGFKIRNRLIDIIEKHEVYNEDARLEIEENLASVGYQIIDRECPDDHPQAEEVINDSDYRYCVYRYKTSKGDYYGVTVFIHFDLPLIGGFLEFPLYGETRILFDKNEVEG